MSGMIHIYTGDGKGKTTASVGLALRAAGRGKRVLFVQFLKDNSSGEVEPLKKSGVTVRGLKEAKFVWQMDEGEKQAMAAEQNQMLKKVLDEYQQNCWDMIILDEIMAAVENQLAEETLVDAIISEKPDDMELVLTGRNAPEKWIAQAQYVTEMQMKKHPFTMHISAREGIEY